MRPPLLPWVPRQRRATTGGEAASLTAYHGGAAALITTRATTGRDRHPAPPSLANALGRQPADPDRTREWGRHVGVIAAYRHQHKVTTDDPRQVLGPYAESDRAGHRA